MKLNWNFQRSWLGGLGKKSLLWGRYGYFQEQHNVEPDKISLFQFFMNNNLKQYIYSLY